MDPLSITASAIAVLGALTAAGKGVKKLLSLRHAPEILQDLANEVESLRLLVAQVQQCFSCVHETRVYHDHEEAMKGILERMRRPVSALQILIDYQLIRPGNDGESYRVSKSEWLMAGTKIEKHRRRICEATNHLTLAMTAMNLQQQALQTQSISLVSQQFQDLQDTVSGLLSTEVEGSHVDLVALADRTLSQLDGHEAKTQAPSAADSSRATEQTALQIAVTTTSSAARVSDQNGSASCVRITATMNVRGCVKFCPCQCHISTHIQTPRLLRGVLGQLFFTHTGIFRANPCNFPRCRKSANKSQFLYYLPTWLAARALAISGYARDIVGPEATWAIRIPSVVQSHEQVWWAVRHGNLSILKNELLTGFRPSTINEFGQTALHVAIDYGWQDMVTFLLAQNADPEIEDAKGKTPVAFALEHPSLNRRAELLRTLNGTIEDIVEASSMTSLHAAAASLPGYSRLTPELLEVEFHHVNSPDMSGMTPLHWACIRGDAPAVELLLQWDANPHATDRRGETCFHNAAWSDDIDSVKAILDAGWPVDIHGVEGKTAMYYAADSGVLELLASRGSDLNHRDFYGATPLHEAIRRSDRPCAVEAFINLGADIHAVGKLGRDALSLAVMYDRPLALQTVLNASLATEATNEQQKFKIDVDGDNCLHLAAMLAGVDVMHVLAEGDLQGCDPTHEDKEGYTPTDCFYLYREKFCTLIRPPFEQEEKAWWKLMESACGQNDIHFDTLELDRRSKDEARRQRLLDFPQRTKRLATKAQHQMSKTPKLTSSSCNACNRVSARLTPILACGSRCLDFVQAAGALSIS